MKRDDIEILGIFIAIIGIVLFFNSMIGGMTGFAILEDVDQEVSSILGILLLVGGLVLAMVGRDQSKDIENEVRGEVWAGRV